MSCDKLLIATGLASIPNWPDIPRKDFRGVVMHSKSIGKRHQELIAESVQHVTVYGGCKSAVDAVILCIQAGKHVDWVIREPGNGNGPGMMVEVRLKTGWHGGIFSGRWKSFINLSLFSMTRFAYNFLHSGKSKVGSWIRKKIWNRLGTAPFIMGPYKIWSDNIEKLMPEVHQQE